MDAAAIEPLLLAIAEEALLAGVELAALVAAPIVEEVALGAPLVDPLGAGVVEEAALLPCVLPSSVLLDCI